MSGTYRSLSFEELSGAHAKLAEAAAFLRPVVEPETGPDPAQSEQPLYLAAIGPDVASTSTELVPLRALPVWDVNGYYRAVGVGWPHQPSRGELRRSYQARDGQRDIYATYALKRLLDTEFRAHYDRRELGQPVDDVFRWEELRRMAADWAAQQSLVTGRAVTVADILGEDITARMAQDVAAEQQAAEQAANGARDRAPQPDLPEVWPYAYYLWGSRCRDEERLARWQQKLIRAFSRHSLLLRVAVGYFQSTHHAAARVRHRRPDGRFVEVLFLNQETEPSASLAEIVVGTYHNHPHGTPLDHPLYLHL